MCEAGVDTRPQADEVVDVLKRTCALAREGLLLELERPTEPGTHILANSQLLDTLVDNLDQALPLELDSFRFLVCLFRDPTRLANLLHSFRPRSQDCPRHIVELTLEDEALGMRNLEPGW